MRPATVSQVTTPVVYPLGLDDAKRHCGVIADDHDETLSQLIIAATDYAETFTDRSFITRTWDVVFDAFPSGAVMYIPRPPLVDVESIVYLDASGASQTWDEAEYTVESATGAMAQQGRVFLKAGGLWPLTQVTPGAVTIRYSAGYGTTAESVPAIIKIAMLQWVADAWSLRGNTIVGTSVSPHSQVTDKLLTPFRSSWL